MPTCHLQGANIDSQNSWPRCVKKHFSPAVLIFLSALRNSNWRKESRQLQFLIMTVLTSLVIIISTIVLRQWQPAKWTLQVQMLGPTLRALRFPSCRNYVQFFLSEHSQIFLSGPNPIFLSEPSQIFLSKQITTIALPFPSHPPHQCTGCCYYRTQVRSLHWLLLSLIDLLTNSLTAV